VTQVCGTTCDPTAQCAVTVESRPDQPLFLRYLLDVEGFLVADVERGANLGDHALNRNLAGGGPEPLLPVPDDH